MPSGSFVQQAIRCPFYRYDDGKRKVTCEGFREENLVSTRWRTQEDFDRHVGIFCTRMYEHCEIYRMVYEAKYEENEDE